MKAAGPAKKMHPVRLFPKSRSTFDHVKAGELRKLLGHQLFVNPLLNEVGYRRPFAIPSCLKIGCQMPGKPLTSQGNGNLKP